MHWLTRASYDRLLAIQLAVASGANQQGVADALGLTRGALKAFLKRTTGCDWWPINPHRLRTVIAEAVILDDPPRHERVAVASSSRAEAANRRAVPAEPSGRLTPDQIEARRIAARAAREAHEAHWLAAERARHGSTIQTRATPLSRMPA